VSEPTPAEPVMPDESPAAERNPYWDYRDLALFIGMAVPSLVTAVLAVKLILWLAGPLQGGRALEVLLGQFTGYGLWFLGLYGLLRARYGRPFWRSLGWVVPPRGLLKSLLLGPAVALWVVFVGVAMNTPEVDMPIRGLMRDRFSVLLMGIFATTLGPLCEELAFRGFLWPLLARSFGAAAAIILSALPFAVLHGPQYGWSWRHVLLIALAGMAFGWSRWRTGSTMAATGMHATYNLSYFTAFLIQGGSSRGPW